ncbi:MAG: hypothetical protein WD939_06675, partial [Dehalococcoidia bacterium]
MGAALAGIVALVVLVMTMGNSSSGTTAFAAVTPAPTYDCDVDPTKPCPDGNLSGVADVIVPLADYYVYMCIARNDHDSATDDIKSAVVCVTDNDAFGDPNNALSDINVPGEGADGVAGPPPPPGYSTLPVNKGIGKFVTTSWTPSDDGHADGNTYSCPTGTVSNCIITITCFPRLGASVLGQNNIALTAFPDPKAQMTSDGFQEGYLVLVTGATNAACDSYDGAGMAAGDWGTLGAVESHPADDKDALCAATPCDQVAWRDSDQRAADGRVDYDDDGCSDFQELDKTDQFKCGDDPWNPYDSGLTDYSGPYTLLAEAARADNAIAGAYFHCIADIQQTTLLGKTDGDIVARAYCYIDNPAVLVNAAVAGACPAACGDGFPGAAPPFPFGDTDSKHTELTGFVDNADNTLKIRGCFEAGPDACILGDVYV